MNDAPFRRSSDRTVDELRSLATELRAMARTAGTADVQAALVALADRFAALADQKSANTANDQNQAAD